MKAMSTLWWKSFHSLSFLRKLQTLVVEAVSAAEAYFPATEQDIKSHNLLHLTDRIRQTGPLQVTSMYPIETLNGQLVRSASNKAHPEATMSRAAAVHQFVLMETADRAKNKLQVARTGTKTRGYSRGKDWQQAANPSLHAVLESQVELTPVPEVNPSRLEPKLTPSDLLELHQLYLVHSPEYNSLFAEFMKGKYLELQHAGES